MDQDRKLEILIEKLFELLAVIKKLSCNDRSLVKDVLLIERDLLLMLQDTRQLPEIPDTDILRDKILRFISDKGNVRSSEIIENFNKIHPRTIRRHLSSLVDENQIDKFMQGKASFYSVKKIGGA